jgi:hypothetical protein
VGRLDERVAGPHPEGEGGEQLREDGLALGLVPGESLADGRLAGGTVSSTGGVDIGCQGFGTRVTNTVATGSPADRKRPYVSGLDARVWSRTSSGRRR